MSRVRVEPVKVGAGRTRCRLGSCMLTGGMHRNANPVNWARLRGLLAGASLFAVLGLACGQAAQAPAPKGDSYPKPIVSGEGKVVAKIGDVEITTAELEMRLRQQSPFTRVQLQDSENKKKFVDNELRMEVLAQEAWRRKLHENPAVIQKLKHMLVTQVMNAELKKLEDKLNVSEVDLNKAYQARHSEFNKPEKVRLSQIVRFVDNDAERAAAKKLLKGIKKKVLAAERKNDPRAFSRFAKQQSQDEATKNGGGDLNFVTRPELVERYGEGVAKFMFDEVKVGDMGVADAPNGVVLFKKTGRRRGIVRTAEMVKPQLRGQVLAEKRTKLFDEYVTGLMKAQGITVNYDLLDEIKVDAGGAPTGKPAAPKPGK